MPSQFYTDENICRLHISLCSRRHRHCDQKAGFSTGTVSGGRFPQPSSLFCLLTSVTHSSFFPPSVHHFQSNSGSPGSGGGLFPGDGSSSDGDAQNATSIFLQIARFQIRCCGLRIKRHQLLYGLSDSFSPIFIRFFVSIRSISSRSPACAETFTSRGTSLKSC